MRTTEFRPSFPLVIAGEWYRKPDDGVGHLKSVFTHTVPVAGGEASCVPLFPDEQSIIQLLRQNNYPHRLDLKVFKADTPDELVSLLEKVDEAGSAEYVSLDPSRHVGAGPPPFWPIGDVIRSLRESLDTQE